MKLAAIIVLAVTAQAAFGQTVSFEPSDLGLSIQGVTVSQPDKMVTVAARNVTGKAITAFAVRLTSRYSDGEQFSYDPAIDFFLTLGSEADSTPSYQVGRMAPEQTRPASFAYQSPKNPEATLKDIHVSVASVIFEDESMVGAAEPLAPLLSIRDGASAEALRWCSDIDRVSGKQITRAALDDFVKTHASAPPYDLIAPFPNDGAGASMRKYFAYYLRQSVQWGEDGTGRLSTDASDRIAKRCDVARQHVAKEVK